MNRLALTRISHLTEFDGEQSHDEILNLHLSRTLSRVRTLLDSENGRNVINNWTTNGTGIKTLLQFLADFDQADGRGSADMPRGLDDLRYIFRDNLRPLSGDLVPGQEVHFRS